jgi:hypothetical protein
MSKIKFIIRLVPIIIAAVTFIKDKQKNSKTKSK